MSFRTKVERELEREILAKYLKAPTLQQILGFVAELGVSRPQFERFFNMPPHTIKKCKWANRPLPVKYWPIIYERVVPTYGLSFNQPEKKKKEPVKRKVVVKTTTNTKSHSRISSLES